jgi:uncharacterized protein YjbJ (UPF0337 family)
MNENEMRGKGKLEEIGGAIKEKAGELTGNERLENEGRGDQIVGQGRQEVGKGVGQVKGAAEDLAGNIKQGLGKLTGDDSLRTEGVADETKGDVRQEFNR